VVSSEKQTDMIERVSGTARRRRVRYFEMVDHWLNRLGRFVAAVHEGCWLGYLSADDLNALTADFYEKSQYYASTEHTLSGFFDWERSALDRYFQPGSSVLVAAAGAGREILALLRAGFHAEGFECNLSLLRATRTILEQLSEPNCLIHCAPDRVPAVPPIYQGIIVGWSSYSHVPTKERRIGFLQSLHRRVLPRSPVLVSFFIRDDRSRYEAAVYRMTTFCRIFARGRREPPERGDRIDMGCYLHSFTREEVEAELRSAGFALAYFNAEGDAHAVGIAE